MCAFLHVCSPSLALLALLICSFFAGAFYAFFLCGRRACSRLMHACTSDMPVLV